MSGSDFAALRALSKLKVLNLHKANISDADVEAIKALPIETLNLEFTQVTPASLKSLKEMRKLKTLFLEEKAFSADDVADLRKSLPGCRVGLVN